MFTAIEDHVARNPDLVTKVGKVFVFKLTSPDSAWTIDVKNGKGSVPGGRQRGRHARSSSPTPTSSR